MKYTQSARLFYLSLKTLLAIALPAVVQASEEIISNDLVVQGDGSSTQASLEVFGDAVISANHYVDGNLFLKGTQFTPSEYLKKGYTSPRSSFLGNDFYSANFDNFLFLSNVRYNVTSVGFDQYRVHELFDGDFESNDSGNRVLPGTNAVVTFDFLAKSEYGQHSLTYPIGHIYITSYSNNVPSGASARYWTKDNVIVNFNPAEDVYGNGRLWKISVPHRLPFMVKLEVTINGPTAGFASIEEIEYHLERPKLSMQRPFISKYTNESLYKNLYFKDANNTPTITLDPQQGKITAQAIELSGTLKTNTGETFYHSGNFSSADIANWNSGNASQLINHQGTSVVSVDSSTSNVGINTSSPEKALHIAGGLKVDGELEVVTGNVTLGGQVKLSQSQGDISMGAFTTSD